MTIYSSLHDAFSHSDYAAIEEMVLSGADLNEQDCSGQTLLHRCAEIPKTHCYIPID